MKTNKRKEINDSYFVDVRGLKCNKNGFKALEPFDNSNDHHCQHYNGLFFHRIH